MYRLQRKQDNIVVLKILVEVNKEKINRVYEYIEFMLFVLFFAVVLLVLLSMTLCAAFCFRWLAYDCPNARLRQLSLWKNKINDMEMDGIETTERRLSCIIINMLLITHYGRALCKHAETDRQTHTHAHTQSHGRRLEHDILLFV